MTEAETVADAMLRAAAVLEAHAESEEGASRLHAIMRDVRALRDGSAELATLRAQLAGVRELVERAREIWRDETAEPQTVGLVLIRDLAALGGAHERQRTVAAGEDRGRRD